jgi:DNA mismatch repair ATPase MutS
VHFGDRVGTDGLAFDYRLREGPATSRNAIALLRLQGAPPELVERAERTARELDARSRLVDRRG